MKPKKLLVGQVYRSTNGKVIMIEEVNDTHFTYVIIKVKLRKGRSGKMVVGYRATCVNSCLGNYIGPIDFEMGDVAYQW